MPIYMPKIKVRYLSISEISTIKEYWNLIVREQFLAITWEPDFSQPCHFCRMLMNYKNFRFTQIPDKFKDMIFLKSPKTLFLGHFCRMGTFSIKSGSVTRNYIWAPNAMLSFRKKQRANSEKTYGQTRTDGQTLFYRTLRPRQGVQKFTRKVTPGVLTQRVQKCEKCSKTFYKIFRR